MTEIKTGWEDWNECLPGALSGFAGRQRSRILRRRMALAGGIVSVCLMSILAWNVFLPEATNSSTEPNYGGIMCSQVKAMGKAHLAGSLDKKTSQKIDRHLAECAVCRSFVEQIRNGQARTSNSKTHRARFVSSVVAWQALP